MFFFFKECQNSNLISYALISNLGQQLFVTTQSSIQYYYYDFLDNIIYHKNISRYSSDDNDDECLCTKTFSDNDLLSVESVCQGTDLPYSYTVYSYRLLNTSKCIHVTFL